MTDLTWIDCKEEMPIQPGVYWVCCGSQIMCMIWSIKTGWSSERYGKQWWSRVTKWAKPCMSKFPDGWELNLLESDESMYIFTTEEAGMLFHLIKEAEYEDKDSDLFNSLFDKLKRFGIQ